MKNTLKFILLAAATAVIIPSLCAKSKKANPADEPKDRLQEEWWKERHEQKLELAKTAKADLLFIGDSITQGWEKRVPKLWEETYEQKNAFNIGFSGDRTEHVLWRLDNGAMDNMQPKVAVIMIGTNNTGHVMQKAEETAAGIKAILERVHKISPNTEILLLAVFPRGRESDDPKRLRNIEINEIIKDYAANEKVTYLDFSAKFIDKDGTLPKSIMPDALHINKNGYKIWIEEMKPTLRKLLRKK